MKIRIEKISSQEIFIVDDVLTKEVIDQFFGYVSKLSYTKNERDDLDDEYPIFSVDFQPEILLKDTEVGKIAKNLISKFYPHIEYELYRSYINLSLYGDMEYPHLDCLKEKDDITLLYYVNDTWDYRWGGETLFYENKDTKIAVKPLPGRYVVFPGNIEHKGSIPTRICKQPRYSLALKYKRIK